MKDRILLLLTLLGDKGCTSYDMWTILRPWFGLGALHIALASLENENKIRSEWLPLRPGRKHRQRIYFIKQV